MDAFRPGNENKPTPTQRQIVKETSRTRRPRSFTKKRYWNHEQHFQSEINPEERQLRLHTKTRQNPSIS